MNTQLSDLTFAISEIANSNGGKLAYKAETSEIVIIRNFTNEKVIVVSHCEIDEVGQYNTTPISNVVMDIEPSGVTLKISETEVTPLSANCMTIVSPEYIAKCKELGIGTANMLTVGEYAYDEKGNIAGVINLIKH